MVEETFNVPSSSKFLRRILKVVLSTVKQTRRRP